MCVLQIEIKILVIIFLVLFSLGKLNFFYFKNIGNKLISVSILIFLSIP